MAEIVRLKKDEILFEKGAQSDEIFILRSGKMLVFDGDKQIEELKPISVIGEISFLEKTPRNFTLKSDAPSSLMVITREQYDEVFAEVPDWYLALFNSVISKLHQTGIGQFI